MATARARFETAINGPRSNRSANAPAGSAKRSHGRLSAATTLDKFNSSDMQDRLAKLKPDERAFVPIVIFVDGTGTVRVQYAGNSPVFKDQASAFPAIAGGLLRTSQKALPPATKPAPKTETKPNQN